MDDPTAWLIGVGALVVVVLLFQFFGVALAAFIAGAIAMFQWASQSGPIGTMAMLALWIFALPVMAVLALVLGVVALCAERAD